MQAEKTLFEQQGFKCQKCGHYDPLAKKLELNKEHKTVLCSVCNAFAPSAVEDFENYLSEKIDSNILETFRKFTKPKKEDSLKKGMMASVTKGNHVSRPAYGYDMVSGELIPAENSGQVRQIFESFKKGLSLNAISRNFGISVNGIKKILKNFTYIGKVKFDNQILQGNHQPILSSELFNEVQQRFEKLKKSK